MSGIEDIGTPTFIGVVISWAFSGISIGQALYYYRTYKDSLPIRTLVATVLILDFCHVACLVDFFFRGFIYAHGNIEQANVLPVSLVISIEVSFLIPSIVQCFYAYRVYKMSHRNWVVTGLIAMLAFVQFVTGIGTTVEIVFGKVVANIHSHKVQLWAAVENSTTVACDFLITGSMVYYLHFGRTGFKNTENLINRLIFYSINLGLLTSFVVTLEVIFFLGFQHSWTFFIFHFAISKCYVNSLLALLNTRNNVRTYGSGSHSMSANIRSGDA